MSETSPGEPSPSQENVQSSGGHVGRRNRRGGKNNRGSTPRAERFVGKTNGLSGHIYDIGTSFNHGETFQKTTREIAEYLGRLFDDEELRTAVLDMKIAQLDKPLAPQDADTNRVAFEEWRSELATYRERVKERSKHGARAYTIILGQCSHAVRKIIESHHTWQDVNGKNDYLALLKLIQQAMITKNTRKHATHSLIDAEQAFSTFHQGASMSDSDYLDRFIDLAEVVMYSGGELGGGKQRVNEYIQEHYLLDPTSLDADAYQTAVNECRDEYLAVSFLTKADKTRYGNLIIDISNEYIRRREPGTYPRTLTAAYDMLVGYTPRMNGDEDISGEGGLTFMHDGRRANTAVNVRGSGGRGRGGRGHGGRGGRGNHRPNRPNNQDNEPQDDEAQFLLENINNLDSDIDTYRAAMPDFATTTAANSTSQSGMVLQVSTRKLPEGWVILDSASTVNMFSDKKLLHDIHTVPHSLTVRCNAGTTSTNLKGYFANVPEPVWYNPRGIANILSLHLMKKYFNITYNSMEGDEFHMHMHNGDILKFKPSGNGLYHLDLAEHFSADNGWTLVTTVKDQKDKYTKRAVNQATLARKVQNIIGRPSTRQMINITQNNLLPNCPITTADIHAADDIFGPNIGSLKGKTVAHPTPHTNAGVDGVPPDIMSLYQHITLAIDIMFINRIPFLVTISRGIKFGTVERLPNRTIPSITTCLNKKVIQAYERRGFTVTTILADPEFSTLDAIFPGQQINCCAADAHIPEVERYIRTIKDRVRSTYTTLPFTRIPRLMLVHMTRNAVFWLNSFPHHDSASTLLSPRYIMTGRRLSYDRHVRLEFGAYVQTHDQHDNTMMARTTGAICLGPTGNAQGSHYFLNLATGSLVTRQRWTELPIPSGRRHR